MKLVLIPFLISLSGLTQSSASESCQPCLQDDDCDINQVCPIVVASAATDDDAETTGWHQPHPNMRGADNEEMKMMEEIPFDCCVDRHQEERDLLKMKKVWRKARRRRKKLRKKSQRKRQRNANRKNDPSIAIYQFAKRRSGAKVDNIFTPQYAAMYWLQEEQAAYNTFWDEDELTRRYVLASLYFSTNGPDWETTNGTDINWLDPGPVCETWSDKAECAPRLRVVLRNETTGKDDEDDDSEVLVALHLNSLGMEGTIIDELGFLSYLTSLNVNSNSLRGIIPSSIGLLTNLEYLNLFDNDLSGSLPEELGLLTKLTYLSAAQNALTGTISNSFASKLTSLNNLHLDDNQFSGSMPKAFCEPPFDWDDRDRITADCSCDDDPRVDCPCCSNCQLDRDEIYDLVRSMSNPSTFADVCSPQHITASWLQEEKARYGFEWSDYELTQRYALGVLYHSMNGPSWKTQADFFKNATVCDWGNGIIRIQCDEPKRENLLYLDLVGANDMPSATLPAEMFYLTELHSMVLTNNDLQGTIPSEISKATGLGSLWLNGNQLSGTVPTEVGFMTNLEVLAWFGNQLTGTLPTEIASLSNLKELNLEGNELRGVIPSQIGTMTGLTSLVLNDNNFVAVPRDIQRMSALEILSINSNNIAGTMHTEFGAIQGLEILDLAGNSLGFRIPSEIGNLRSLRELDLSRNRMLGVLPSQIGRLSGLGKCILIFTLWTVHLHLGSLTDKLFAFVVMRLQNHFV